MLAVISPAKTLDFETPPLTDTFTLPDFLDHSDLLISALRRVSKKKLGALMSISADLAELNARRYAEWHRPFTPANAKPALMAFKGDVYRGIELDRFRQADFEYAQRHLRILSGLYGLLRPLDLIQPYRLEMGTKLATRRGKDLYKFWDGIMTPALNEAIEASGGGVLINLASNEYFGAVNRKALDARVVSPAFKDLKNGSYKILSFFAKQARGAMSDFMIRNRISDPEGLKDFTGMGYRFNPSLSKGDDWVFTRDSPTG
ncbi:MAG: peroxide stress protein YaaA [Verrucomicrobiae bacterium]|nr:peroxide stress protein YaaA [Verrucomicrobiae bacterium]